MRPPEKHPALPAVVLGLDLGTPAAVVVLCMFPTGYVPPASAGSVPGAGVCVRACACVNACVCECAPVTWVESVLRQCCVDPHHPAQVHNTWCVCAHCLPLPSCPRPPHPPLGTPAPAAPVEPDPVALGGKTLGKQLKRKGDDSDSDDGMFGGKGGKGGKGACRRPERLFCSALPLLLAVCLMWMSLLFPAPAGAGGKGGGRGGKGGGGGGRGGGKGADAGDSDRGNVNVTCPSRLAREARHKGGGGSYRTLFCFLFRLFACFCLITSSSLLVYRPLSFCDLKSWAWQLGWTMSLAGETYGIVRVPLEAVTRVSSLRADKLAFDVARGGNVAVVMEAMEFLDVR